jgi:hypothetical protein
MKNLIALLLSLFLFLSVTAQINTDTLSAAEKEDISVSTYEIIVAPLDSIMLVKFTTVDDVRVAIYTNAVYYRPGDFLIVSWSRDIMDIIEGGDEMFFVKGPIEITYK